MPRANRHFLPNHIWHITHRCQERQFLLKFAKDRRSWLYWLFEAKKRFALCVLDYTVTCNHIHLLVLDQGRGEISRSMQLVAGRTAQQYNRRKHRKGAFWEDRYHATAVDTEGYLARCLTYIDLNMVRAGVVSHPALWETGGYREIQNPRVRYRIVDLVALMELLGIGTQIQLQQAHTQWVAEALRAGSGAQEEMWSKSLAVGSKEFVTGVKERLGVGSRYRRIEDRGTAHHLRETGVGYTAQMGLEMDDLNLLRLREIPEHLGAQ